MAVMGTVCSGEYLDGSLETLRHGDRESCIGRQEGSGEWPYSSWWQTQVKRCQKPFQMYIQRWYILPI